LTNEEWTPGIYVPTEDGVQQIAGGNEFTILADSGQRKVTIRGPKSILGENPESWHFAAVVLSQEGFLSSGVMRVRDVLPKAEQWRLGGAPLNTTNHTCVVDLVWPMEGDQERWLSDYLPTDKPQSELTAQDFARVSMFGAED
jgi:carbohydrate-binding DOMON domain-containing protein